MREIIGYFRSGFASSHDFCMNALEEVLLWCRHANPAQRGEPADGRVREAVSFLRSRFRERLDVAAVAEHCALSPSRLAHLFTFQTGLSPMRYLERHRIGVAQEMLLSTSRPIAQVAYGVGFEDPLYFSQVFRKQMGVSPREFRRRGV